MEICLVGYIDKICQGTVPWQIGDCPLADLRNYGF